MSRICSFPPLASPDARILILGSMPGVASLAAGQYYAHPRNLFWPIMGDLFGASPSLPYPARAQILQRHGIALWDVLASCVRKGSLDAAISDGQPNDVAGFIAGHRQIQHVFFNGAMADTCFRRAVLPTLIDAVPTCTRLPSTSPAHAGMSRAEKLDAWRGLEKALGERVQDRNRPPKSSLKTE